MENIRDDMRKDSLLAPGTNDQHWLLYPAACSVHGNGSITCMLCKSCRTALGTKFWELPSAKSKAKASSLPMPQNALANGLWRGPDVPALQALTYAEAKVINRARLYVSVKRVFLDRASYARQAKNEMPSYHQKNVVAYPQNFDAALQATAMSPWNLAQTITVQYVGDNREALRHERDLQISVARLRSAFIWLSVNSWPFMEATRDHEAWESGSLHCDLETLLSAYTESIGGIEGDNE